MLSCLLTLTALSVTFVAGQDSSNTATVDVATLRGKPQHLASGIIYGMPDDGFPGMNPNQIPNHFYKDIGFRYGRAGGAQMTQGGWVDGLEAYQARFNSYLQNYRKCRQVGARMQILPHDIWGTDHSNSSAYWPGDNGNWTIYDNFLNQLMSDLVSNNALTGLDWDLWNEPDGGSFWLRSQDQYLAMWNRTFHTLRANKKFAKVLIVGPSTSHQPYLGNTWWENYLQYVVNNSVVPQQYTWHDEPGDPENDYNNFQPMLTKYSAPTRPININEYATFDQQNSAGAAWFISRLERFNMLGLRGNWLSTCQLHDFMASLLGKANQNSCGNHAYFPTGESSRNGPPNSDDLASDDDIEGEWRVYNYYYRNMTGQRATTATSGDGVIDVYTTVDSDYVRTLTGVLNNVGTWYITINNLTSVGLPAAGTLNIQTYGFPWDGHMASEGTPTNLGIYGHQYSGGSVTFPVFQTSSGESTAWVFEFATGSASQAVK